MAPGARPEVDDDRRVEVAGPLDGPPRQQLRLRPGHEHPGADGQLDVAEVRATGQVLQRLAGGPAADQGVVRRPVTVGDLVDEHEAAAVDLEDVGQQDLGVGLGAGDAGVGQPADGLGDERAPLHSATAASRASRSASTADSITGWRSPSSTTSRL